MNTLLKKLTDSQREKHNSQFGETGVLDALFNYLGIKPTYCVEFGSGTVSKNKGTANIRYFNDTYNTQCLYFETNRNKITSSDEKYKKQIHIEAITASNVNEIFKKYNVPEKLDLVVIDVDGQDYWIWEKLEYKPSTILIEFNPTLPYTESKVMHYDEKHYTWRNTNCLYYGASIAALKKLGEKKGYSLVYKTERNLIFTKKELLDIDRPLEELHPKPLKDFRSSYINEQKWVNV